MVRVAVVNEHNEMEAQTPLIPILFSPLIIIGVDQLHRKKKTKPTATVVTHINPHARRTLGVKRFFFFYARLTRHVHTDRDS